MNDNSRTTSIPHTDPIPIIGRNRSASLASTLPALSNSPTSSVQTPSSTLSLRLNGQSHARSVSESSANGGGDGSPTSPLAYFLGAATSPIRTTTGGGFPWNASKGAPVIDEDEESPPGGANAGLFGVGGHTRRGSWAQNPLQATTNQVPTSDRGTGVLRRLSLSNTFQRPTFGTSPNVPAAPPPSAVSTSPVVSRGVPTLGEPRLGRKPRSVSLAVPNSGHEGSGKKRGISPMGERLLKGHFDGFI
ncbi:hypothetical protein FS837_007103 [Tulasnella sp. UAMH 9824]|nr:hypothetical protein FS837_007103 [Tulasnella sp. UAMH 9824]